MTMRQLPDISQCFARLVLKDAIATCPHNSLFAQSCATAVEQDYAGVIKMMADQIRDNAPLMVDMFGPFVILKLDEIHGPVLTAYQRWQLSQHGNILSDKCAPTAWNGPLRDYRAEQREMEEQGL